MHLDPNTGSNLGGRLSLITKNWHVAHQGWRAVRSPGAEFLARTKKLGDTGQLIGFSPFVDGKK